MSRNRRRHRRQLRRFRAKDKRWAAQALAASDRWVRQVQPSVVVDVDEVVVVVVVVVVAVDWQCVVVGRAHSQSRRHAHSSSRRTPRRRRQQQKQKRKRLKVLVIACRMESRRRVDSAVVECDVCKGNPQFRRCSQQSYAYAGGLLRSGVAHALHVWSLRSEAKRVLDPSVFGNRVIWTFGDSRLEF